MRFGSTLGVAQADSVEDGLRRIASAGYAGVEVTGNTLVQTAGGAPLKETRPLTPTEVNQSMANFTEVGELMQQLGLELVSMTFGWFWVGRFELDAMEDYFRLARAAGAPALKVAGVITPERLGNYWDALAVAQKQMATICGFAEKHGVRALIELHDGYVHESASQARRLCEPFDPQWLGVIHDPENMIRSGKEHWPHSFDILGPYLAYVHWKNMGYRYDTEAGRWQSYRTPLGKGLVDWRLVVEALHARDFSGFLMNENGFLGDAGALDNDLDYMRSLLADVSS